ncbi:MAG: diguanylate cyclase [Gammaproteobacteria bacterium]|jgi:diguanylate cyclase (GGDEF)-like protein
MLDHIKPELVQEFLESLPAALAMVDKDNTIVWVNDSFVRITTLPREQLTGAAISSLPHDLQSLFKQGHTYLDATNRRDAYWLACMSVQLEDYTLQYCTDVTELQGLIQDRENLKTRVAELNPHDPVTGMLNRRALFQNLEQQASRSRRYGNTVSVMIMRIANLLEYIRHHGNENADRLLVSVSQTLNDQMRWADVIGRLDKTEFLFILPETSEEVTRELREKVQEHVSKIPLPDVDDGSMHMQLEFGMAQWRKGDDVGMLMQRARHMLDDEQGQRMAG